MTEQEVVVPDDSKTICTTCYGSGYATTFWSGDHKVQCQSCFGSGRSWLLPHQMAERIAKLASEIEQWKTWGIVEIAVRNPAVAEYMEHWEGRATRAEDEQNQFLSLVCKYQCNPTGQLSNFEAIRNHLEVAHRLCNDNYDWAKRLEAELARLQWQPISAENLPKVGDEVTDGRIVLNCNASMGQRTYAQWRPYERTYFRPFDPPKPKEAS